MKPLANILFIGLIASVATYATIKLTMHQPSSGILAKEEKLETAYERVMRTKTIRCGYFVWEPYISKDPNTGEFSGINYDVINAIGRKLGLKIEWTMDTDVAGIVQGLETGKFDVMCATLWPNPGIIQSVTMTRPEFYTPVYGVARVNDNRFDGDLQKANDPSVRVSAIDSDITADLAKEFLPKAKEAFLPQTGSGSDILLQVMTDKADIAFVDKGLINNFIKNNPNSLKAIANMLPVRVFGERMAIGRNEFALKEMLDTALEQLVNDHSIEQLVQKYEKSFNTEIYAPSEGFVKK